MRAHRKARCFDPDQYALTITIAAATFIRCSFVMRDYFAWGKGTQRSGCEQKLGGL